MVAITGAWTLQTLDTAAIGRYHDLALLGAGTSTLTNSSRSGVIPSTGTGGTYLDLAVAQRAGGANMSVDVAPGAGVINRSGQGPYVAISTSSVNVTITTANPTNPRIDLIIMRVYDGVLSDGSTQATIEVVAGTPASSPVAPSLPTNAGGGVVSIALAQVLVAAGASSIVTANITDVRQSTGPRHGIRPILPGDAWNGTTSPAAFMNGETVYHDGGTGVDGTLATWVNNKWNTLWLSPGRGWAKYVATVARSYTTNNNLFKFEFDSGSSTTADITAAVGSGYANLTDFTFQRAGLWDVRFYMTFNFLSTQPAGWIALNLQNSALTTSYRNDANKLLDGTGGANGATERHLCLVDSFNVGDTLSATFNKWDSTGSTYTTGVSSPGFNCITFRWVGPT